MTSYCRLSVSYKAIIIFYPVNSNWHLASSCQFIKISELITGQHLPVDYLALIVLNHPKSNWHLAELSVANLQEYANWLPFDGVEGGGGGFS